MCKIVLEAVVWLFMTALLVMVAKELIYPRIVYGPPCEQVAENKVVCFANWPK